MSEIYRIISMVAFGISAVCLILSVFFWIKFNIPKIIGDLSGRNARRSIEEMREKNSKQVSDYSNRAVDYNKMSNAGRSRRTGRTTTGRIAVTGSSQKTGRSGTMTGSTARSESFRNPDFSVKQTGETAFQQFDDSYGTEKLGADNFGDNNINMPAAEEGTEILSPAPIGYSESYKADENIQEFGETEVLVGNSSDYGSVEPEGTSVLSEEMPAVIVRSVTIVHTDEVI